MAPAPAWAVNILLVGAGDVAGQYAAALPDSRLSIAGVCDTDRERAEAFAADHGAPAFADLDAALDAVDAPVALNLTGHRAHAPVTRDCLAAGRHVFSEKPLALAPDAAGDLLAAAADRDLGLGCAPITPSCPAQRLAGRAVADGRLGRVGLGYAHAHVGRVTEWHDRPDSFLAVGPLYDGGVYPLSLLVAWFGPVREVRVADALDVWPDREPSGEAPTHVEATLSFDGPTVRLTASLYAPHRGREFYGLELHGDDGSLYLADAGTMAADREAVAFGREGREYTPMPPAHPGDAGSRTHLDGVERFAAAVAAGRRPRRTARRGAHVVAVCAAVEAAAAGDGPVAVEDFGVEPALPAAPTVRPASESVGDGGIPAEGGDAADAGEPGRRAALRLPRVGFAPPVDAEDGAGDGDPLAAALDAGFRLLDLAAPDVDRERAARTLAAPGTPDRDGLLVLDGTDDPGTALGDDGSVDAGSTADSGTADAGVPGPAGGADCLVLAADAIDGPLGDAWRDLERARDRGEARTLGVAGVDADGLERVLDAGTAPPALVRAAVHPYRPRSALVERCHELGIRVVGRPTPPPSGLLDEPAVRAVAERRDLSPAAVVPAWNAARGVVPTVSERDPERIVDALAAGAEVLTTDERARLDDLADAAADE